jgi:hypothetical protein
MVFTCEDDPSIPIDEDDSRWEVTDDETLLEEEETMRVEEVLRDRLLSCTSLETSSD